ncbi:phosphatidylinositol alpha 1,6-mannosyltransferase [Phycisphaerales bacterium]|nr:phosphatidylinositol alpha 1,6-mannosyltransferase [Phycisphaerales bacterium]
MRVLLFTDTLGDVNGVSRFIRNAAEHSLANGQDLQVVTSTNFECPREANIHNFKPIFATKMPRYAHLELALPPLVRMLRFAGAHRPDVIHISTPGPVGVVGMIASRMLRAPIVGVYHTDFPAYVDHLFNDDSLTYFTSRFMRAFYSPFRSILTRSREYVASLERLGMQRERILPLKPGIMTGAFHPCHRDEFLLERMGSPRGCVRVLSVGRVSVEKNLPLLTRVWIEADRWLRASGIPAELVVVGDGPYRAEMEMSLRRTRSRFLGFRYGEELSRVYASCDLFVFPSVTDTLGQVVMEAQASGIPVLVSDEGGPKEVVEEGRTGHVITAADAQAWTSRIVDLCRDHRRRREMGRSAHEAMQAFSMDRSFEHFWRVHEDAWVESLARKRIRARGGQPAANAEPSPQPADL